MHIKISDYDLPPMRYFSASERLQSKLIINWWLTKQLIDAFYLFYLVSLHILRIMNDCFKKMNDKLH